MPPVKKLLTGLRLFPWVREHRNDQQPTYLDCATCMADVPESMRAEWGCGRMPVKLRTGTAYPRAHEPFEGIGETSLCPGYYVNLPAVGEVTHAHAWWSEGQLREWCDGETPPRALRDAITVLHSAYNDVEANRLREMKKGTT